MSKVQWHQRMVTQAMALQLAVIALVLVVTSVILARAGQSALEEQYGLRAQSIAESVAEIPEVRELIGSKTPNPQLQQIAESIRVRTGVTFIVIVDPRGIRHSHPKPERIGLEVSTSPNRALAGIPDWYVETGTLGPSVRGKVPIWDAAGEEVIGIVSVGMLSTEVSETLRGQLASLVGASGLAFGLGAIAAFVGSRRIRGQMHGLEPPEIAALYEQREGMLQSLHEGVMAVDNRGSITVLNDEARILLDLEPETVGRQLKDVAGLARLHDMTARNARLRDVPMPIGGRTLLVGTTPVFIRGKATGTVFTMRDLTELHGLLGELEQANHLVDALRAQAHEHANELHAVSGLIELDRAKEALNFIGSHSASQRELTYLYEVESGDRLIVALLLSKASIANERDIHLLTQLGELPEFDARVSRNIVTILGNLVSNAIDHLSTSSLQGGEIEVSIWVEDQVLHVEVADNGHGIPNNLQDRVFEQGFTTKDARVHEGIGLALVHELVSNAGGLLTLESVEGSGTIFTINYPIHSPSSGTTQ